MQYLLLLYGDENGNPGGDAEQDVLRRYGAFTQEVRESGKLLAADRLQPTSTATTVRIRNGETLVTDGPFAETKEQLGGFYLLECENLDEAIAHAQKIPAAEFGSIEVRPIWVM